MPKYRVHGLVHVAAEIIAGNEEGAYSVWQDHMPTGTSITVCPHQNGSGEDFCIETMRLIFLKKRMTTLIPNRWMVEITETWRQHDHIEVEVMATSREEAERIANDVVVLGEKSSAVRDVVRSNGDLTFEERNTQGSYEGE